MASLDEIRKERIRKLEDLRARDINPYPIDCQRTHRIVEVLEKFDDIKEASIVGRVMNLRSFGGSIFADIFDGSGKIQAYLKKDKVGSESFEIFEKDIDSGDFIEVKGTPFTTKKGEKSLLAKEWRILSKSLRSLPEKWHGLQDHETKLRQRYLDILLDPETRELFRLKEKFWETTRGFLKKDGFMEVETPTLEVTTGGAEARPFKTYHNDFDFNIFLRISVGELWQKRLMAAGFEKTFEIGRVYRNEGSSPEHVQEFTNMEFYASYMDFEDGKNFVKKLYQTIAQEVFGKTVFETRGHKFDLAGEWQELDYVKTVEKMTGVNVIEASERELANKLKELKVEYTGENRERMTDSLWKYCRKNVSGPAFLINHPKLVAPLSKENSDNPKLTKTFQVVIAGSEIGRAHAELNDPLDQKERFDKQSELIEGGDEEAMMPDHAFVEMLEYGMPPTFGFGFGERLFAFLVDRSLRETQIFPLMKPREDN